MKWFLNLTTRNKLFLGFAASSQQQMVGMDQVAQAMENIKQASVQNVSGTRQAESPHRACMSWGRNCNNWRRSTRFSAGFLEEKRG